MPSWQIPGVPPVPSITDLMRMVQVQAELMADLPETVSELTLAVRGLAETLEVARETVAVANKVVERLDVLIDELQDPVKGLRPSIERVNEVLDAPVIERIPSILESVESAVIPVAQSAERMRERMARASAKARSVLPDRSQEQ